MPSEKGVWQRVLAAREDEAGGREHLCALLRAAVQPQGPPYPKPYILNPNRQTLNPRPFLQACSCSCLCSVECCGLQLHRLLPTLNPEP
eukprot:2882642-Rhodomonas_salina.1